MTTRPPQPGPRPPQRTLSGSGMLQRQAQQQRFLQQQSQLSSPGWPIPNVVDLTGDGGDTLGPRQDMPRVATSGLRTEVAMDAKDALGSPAASPTASPAPKGLTAHTQPRGKPAFLVSRETPFSATGGPSTFSGAPTLLEKASTQSKMPFPRRPPNFIPQHTRPKVSEPRGPLKKDTRPKPYVLEVPSIAPKYGANGKS
jgi:mediator of RNA polymerase II transcription subunit 12